MKKSFHAQKLLVSTIAAILLATNYANANQSLVKKQILNKLPEAANLKSQQELELFIAKNWDKLPPSLLRTLVSMIPANGTVSAKNVDLNQFEVVEVKAVDELKLIGMLECNLDNSVVKPSPESVV